jgi:hypothetical protein
MTPKFGICSLISGGCDYTQNAFEGLKIEASEAVLLYITPSRGKPEAKVYIKLKIV